MRNREDAECFKAQIKNDEEVIIYSSSCGFRSCSLQKEAFIYEDVTAEAQDSLSTEDMMLMQKEAPEVSDSLKAEAEQELEEEAHKAAH